MSNSYLKASPGVSPETSLLSKQNSDDDVEFSGTLVGFDDYVSEFGTYKMSCSRDSADSTDMVLEDVTEL